MSAQAGLTSFFIAFVLLILSCPSDRAYAQAPPIRGEGGTTEFFQGRAVRTFARFVVADRVLTDGREQPNQQHRRVVSYVQPFAFNYAVARDLNLTVVAPIVVKRLHGVVTPDLRTTSGLGDLALVGKYRFWKKLGRQTRTDAAIRTGIKLPTGSTGARDATGNRLPIPAQAGTGSTDAFIQGAISHENSEKGFGLFSDLTYTAKTEGKGYAFGDTIELDWGASKRLYPWRYTDLKPVEFYTELGFLYRHAGQDQNLGAQVPSTGGDALFWAPGFTSIVRKRFLFEVSFQFPMSQRPTGTQLAQGWNVLFGTRIIY